MTGKEQGFLLLTSHLGNPNRPCLTTAQFRTLAQRVRQMERPTAMRELNSSDLRQLGYDTSHSQRILALLEDGALLSHYLYRGSRSGCIPLTRLTEEYPSPLRKRLGDDAPGCIWTKGPLALLGKPAVALVGSRELSAPNAEFAREVGRQAALQGYVLISGNARGADKTAQDSCLYHGGEIISVIADRLDQQPPDSNILYLSEDGFDLPFSAQRALSRNRIIHALGCRTFVAQAQAHRGGTWDGAAQNLRHRWSPVSCFQDGSNAAKLLTELGADSIFIDDLSNFQSLNSQIIGLFDQ